MFASSFRGPAISTFHVPDLARLMRCSHRGVLSASARAGPPLRSAGSPAAKSTTPRPFRYPGKDLGLRVLGQNHCIAKV